MEIGIDAVQRDEETKLRRREMKELRNAINIKLLCSFARSLADNLLGNTQNICKLCGCERVGYFYKTANSFHKVKIWKYFKI
jgi:hypothetical protein